MLLIGCTAGAFTACSDGDDDQKPSCPITEYTVPSTAEIGGFYTVTGKGFEASAQLFLRNASGTETAAADQTVTAAGIECTVPSTLTTGVYTVVVKQNGSWDLGPVRLEAAQNPVSSVVLPAAIKLNKTLEIAGNGFTSASRIFLETADAAKTRTELTAVPSSTGISCTIPDGVAAGTYNVILKHNNIDWTLGENIPAAVYKRLTGISYAMSQTCDFSTVEGGVEAVKAILLEMVGNDQEMADMYFEMLFSEGTNVVSQLSLKYGSDNRVTAVQQGEGADAADWYTFSFDGDKVSALNKMYEDGESGIRAFSWVLNGGKVESSNVDFMRTVSGEVVSRPAVSPGPMMPLTDSAPASFIRAPAPITSRSILKTGTIRRAECSNTAMPARRTTSSASMWRKPLLVLPPRWTTIMPWLVSWAMTERLRSTCPLRRCSTPCRKMIPPRR